MWIFCLLLCLPAILLAAVATHASVKYTRMIGDILLELSYALPQEGISAARGEKITILDSAGHEIEALLLDNKNSDKLVIFCPESGTTKESWEKYAYFLPEMGYRVLSLDFPAEAVPGQGGAHFPWASSHDTARLLTAIRWAKNAFGVQCKIVLFGISKGANIAVDAASQERSVRAVIADGLFSMKGIFRDYIRKWAPVLVRSRLLGSRHPDWAVGFFTEMGFWYCQRKCRRRFVNVETLLKRPHPPLLVIHGEADDYISATHRTFLDKIQPPHLQAEHLVVPKARHNEAVLFGRSLYERKITDFLKHAT